VLLEHVHVSKGLEYMVIKTPNLGVYHLIYCLQNYIVVEFVPPMLGSVIKLEDFEHMLRIKDLKFREYLAYNIICGYIIFHENHNFCEKLEKLIGYLGVYAIRY
jgi:hypothetical protein